MWDLEIKTASNEIDRALIKAGEHTKVDEQTAYKRKAKMEVRDRIIGVDLQNDKKIWKVSHKGTLLMLIFALIGRVCWNSSRKFETVDTNCWIEELLFKGTIANYS